jgi:hypothetical protein
MKRSKLVWAFSLIVFLVFLIACVSLSPNTTNKPTTFIDLTDANNTAMPAAFTIVAQTMTVFPTLRAIPTDTVPATLSTPKPTATPLPDWAFSVFLYTIVGVYLEVVSRLGPKEFDAPISQFLKLSARDKVVLLSAFAAIIMIMWFGKGFDSDWIKLLFLVVAFLVLWLILSLFGSKELKELIQRTLKG